MKLSQLVYSLFTLASVVTAANDDVDIHVEQYIDDEEEGRHLQLGSGICQLVTNSIFGGFFECDCAIQILAGNITVDCETDAICSPGGLLCAQIGVGIDIELFGGGLPDVSFCLSNATFGEITLLEQPFCIGTSLLGRAGQQSCPDGLLPCIRSGKAASIKTPQASVSECDVTVGNEKCNSCIPCDGRGGVTFDCSNVVEGLKSSTCSKFRVPTGLGSRTLPRLPDVVLDQ